MVDPVTKLAWGSKDYAAFRKYFLDKNLNPTQVSGALAGIAKGGKAPFTPHHPENVLQTLLAGATRLIRRPPPPKELKGVAGLAVKGAREVARDLPPVPRDLLKVVGLQKMGSLRLEKVAIDPLMAALGLGGAFHVGANVAAKSLWHPGKLLSKVPGVRGASRLFSTQRQSQLAKGVREGLSGKKRPTSSRTLELATGPELFANRPVGQELGENLREMSKGKRYRFLKKLRKEVASTPELRKTPVFEDVVGGVNKLFAGGKLPKAKKGMEFPREMMGKPQRAWEGGIKPYLPIAAVGTAIPKVMVHSGVNLARLGTAYSKPGKKYMREEAAKGVLGKHLPSLKRSKGMERAVDTLISPMAGSRGPRVVANDLARLAETNPKRFVRLAGLAGHIPEFRRSVIQAVQKARGVAPEVRERILRSLGQAP